MPLARRRIRRAAMLGGAAPVARTAAVVGTAAAVARPGPSPVARTAATVGTAAVVARGVRRRSTRRAVRRRF
jgi:hypothetical protein